MACSKLDEVNTSNLEINNEEAGTRIILDCMGTKSETIVVSAHDTDIFILLVAHFADIGCSNVWMKAGTHKKPKYIPIMQVVTVNGLNSSSAQLLLLFHSLTGCKTS